MYFGFAISDSISVNEFKAIRTQRVRCVLRKLGKESISTHTNTFHYERPSSHILLIPSSVTFDNLHKSPLFNPPPYHSYQTSYIFIMVKINVALLASGLFSVLVTAAPSSLVPRAYTHFPDHAVCPISKSSPVILPKQGTY